MKWVRILKSLPVPFPPPSAPDLNPSKAKGHTLTPLASELPPIEAVLAYMYDYGIVLNDMTADMSLCSEGYTITGGFTLLDKGSLTPQVVSAIKASGFKAY